LRATDHAELTWYEATAKRGPPEPALAGAISADVCVIGGGLAGLTAALELARRGKQVVLLEAKRLSWAASGRNGGFVSNGFAQGLDAIAQRVGKDATRHLYELSRFGTEYVRREISDSDPTIQMGEGWLTAMRHEGADRLRSLRDRLVRDYGVSWQYLDRMETQAHMASDRYFQSVYDPTAFHMHPLRYGLLLAGKAKALGVRIFENTAARALAEAGPDHLVRTEGGEVRAGQIVLAVSALDLTLHRLTGRSLLPVATYVAVTAPMTQSAIAPGRALSDTRRAGNYFRCIDEGRILWGGAITTKVSEPARLAEVMRRDMVETFPQLAAVRMEYAWAGLMAYALHKMPLIGGDGRGLWWATGFGGHGMNTTAMAGILLARAIAGGDDEYRRFAAFSPRWAGGPLGRVGVQASYWWMQLRDRLDEARSRRKP